MGRIEKTVFISYRRSNPWFARAVLQDLTQHGYDVFLDYTGLASGDFESVILENIRARAHFLIILTPSALKRCSEPGDWLRREIETALDAHRNIVSLTLEGFKFDSVAIKRQLTGSLALLKHYNALNVPAEYFEAAMDKLRSRFLNVALDSVSHPISQSASLATKTEQAAALTAPAVTQNELTAEEWFERAFNSVDLDEKLLFYSNAILLNPKFFKAFNNRGLVCQDKGDLEGALHNYSEAIRLEPDDAGVWYNQGLAHYKKGDLEAAIYDYDTALCFDPNDGEVFYNRGNAKRAIGDLMGALQDYDEAVELSSKDPEAFYNRGLARYQKGDLKGALQDFDVAVRLKPDDFDMVFNRAYTRYEKGDLDGALQDYNDAIRLKPTEPTSYYNRAEIWQAKNQHAAAISDFQKYLGLKGGLENNDVDAVNQTILLLKKNL